MFKHYFKHAVAAVAALGTTLTLFSAVASLADSDQSVILAAKIKPATLAANTTGTMRR